MASDNATVVGKSNKKSKLRRKKKFVEVDMGKQEQKRMWDLQYFICKCQWFQI